jgi:hypothetical protein
VPARPIHKGIQKKQGFVGRKEGAVMASRILQECEVEESDCDVKMWNCLFATMGLSAKTKLRN